MGYSLYIGFETQEPDEDQGGKIVTWHRFVPELQELDISGITSRTLNYILSQGGVEWDESGTYPIEKAIEAIEMLRLPVQWLSLEDNERWARYADRLEWMVEAVKLNSTSERTLEIYWA